MPTEITEGMQTTPDLDQAVREGQQTFDGAGPDDDAAAPLIPGTSGPDENADGDGKKEDALAGEMPGETTARIKKEDTPPETDFRFKDHSEAEKGYRELQGKATRAEQRAAAAESELNRVRNAEKIKAEAEAARATIVDFAADRRAQALEEIDGLDPEDNEYRKKAARLLSQADIDIYDHYQTQGRTSFAATADVAAGEAAETVAEPEKAAQYVYEKLTAEGFDKSDPLFWQYATRAPTIDAQGKPTSLDIQIQWAVSQTKQYHDSIRAKLRSEEEARVAETVRKNQAANLPLGRGTSGGGTPAGKNANVADDTTISLSDAVEYAAERRRL